MSRILVALIAAFAVAALGACAEIGKGKGKGKAPVAEPVMAPPPPAEPQVFK